MLELASWFIARHIADVYKALYFQARLQKWWTGRWEIPKE